MVVKHKVFNTDRGKRILCISQARGSLKQINRLASIFKAYAVVHTGSFGFFDGESADRMSATMLASAARASPLTATELNYDHMDEATLRESVGSQLSELPLYLAGVASFSVPVYTIWGADEDVHVVEKFRNGFYKVPNLHLVDEHSTPLLAGTNIRLLGVPGEFDIHELFNIDQGTSTPGNSGSTWTGVWQIGELVHTAAKIHDPEEVRVLMSHSSADESPFLQTLALALKCDFTLSRSSNPRKVTAGFNCLNSDSDSRKFSFKLQEARGILSKIWSLIENHVSKACGDDKAKKELIVSTVELLTADFSSLVNNQQAFRNLWHFGVCDVAHNFLLLNWKNGQISVNAEVAKLDQKLRGEEYRPGALSLGSLGAADYSSDALEGRRLAAEAKRLKLKEKRKEKIKEKKFKSLESKSREQSENGTGFEHGDDSRENNIDRTADSSVGAETPNDDSLLSGISGLESPNNELHNSDNPSNGSSSPELLKSLPSGPADKTKSAKAEKAPFDRLKPVKPKLEKARPGKEPGPARPGLWFKNGDRSPEEILSFLAQEDRDLNPKVEIKSETKPNGMKANIALVYFDTQEEASAAYDRVNKDEAGTVTIHHPKVVPAFKKNFKKAPKK